MNGFSEASFQAIKLAIMTMFHHIQGSKSHFWRLFLFGRKIDLTRPKIARFVVTGSFAVFCC